MAEIMVITWHSRLPGSASMIYKQIGKTSTCYLFNIIHYSILQEGVAGMEFYKMNKNKIPL